MKRNPIAKAKMYKNIPIIGIHNDTISPVKSNKQNVTIPSTTKIQIKC